MKSSVLRSVLLTAVTLFAGLSYAQTCTVSNMNDDGAEVAVWLISGPYADNYVFADEGTFAQNEDGTASLTGLVTGSISGNTLDFGVFFENGSTWSEWSAMGRGYKDEPGIVGDNYLDYMYYEMSSSSYMIVNGSEDTLYLNHAPSNFYYGFQVGMGANATTATQGLGGWFTYTSAAGSGQGDILIDGDCPIDPGPCQALSSSISTTSETTICADDGLDDLIDVTVDAAGAGSNTGWVITDSDLNILGLPPSPPFNLEGAGAGTCLIWQINSEDDLTGAVVGENAADLSGCFALSNSIAITRLTGDDCPDAPCEATAANISTASETTFCTDDDITDDIVSVSVDDAGVGTNATWVITTEDLIILGLPAGPEFNFDGVPAGTCLIWLLNHEDDLTGAIVGESAANLGGCFALSNSIAVTRLTGDDCPDAPCEATAATISTASETTFCTDDDITDDIVSVSVDDAGIGTNATWVITTEDLIILGLPAGPEFNFDGVPAGTCLIWLLNHEDDLTGAIVGESAANLGGCFALSNSIAVTRLTGDDCPTVEIPGCMDAAACNYDPAATFDDGTCVLATGCDECDGTGGVIDNLEIGDACDDGDSATENDMIVACGDCVGEILEGGCIDETACNYDMNATIDDGSCLFATGCDECDGNGGVTDNPEIGDTCDDGDDLTFNDVYVSCDLCEGIPDEEVLGCTDEVACNYDPIATMDDGTCLLATGCDVCDGNGGVTDNPEVGEVCDDGNPDTNNDMIQVDCSCSGMGIEDADNDGIADANDNCVNTPNPLQENLDGDEEGDACDDDIDGDGVDNANDCDPTDGAIFGGATCDDGNSDTENDMIGEECQCAGTLIDADGDGIADSQDVCPGFNDNLLGMSCDDGDANTDNDIYTDCDVCQGTPVVTGCSAGAGLENIIVEKYYVSDANDATNTALNNSIAEGSVTYRIYIDMAPGYELETVYGLSGNELMFSSTADFYNTPFVGKINGGLIESGSLPTNLLGINTLALDSWLTFGRASDIHVGTLKGADTDGSIIGGANSNGFLVNDNSEAGIPLTTADGLAIGNVGGEGFQIIAEQTTVDQINALFGNSNASGTFTTENGAYAVLGGTVGTNAENQILIGQFTTAGDFSFLLNFRLGVPGGGTEDYLHSDCNLLSYSSASDTPSLAGQIGSVGALVRAYPNPNNGEELSLELANMPAQGEEVIVELVDAYGHVIPMTQFNNEEESSSRTLNFDTDLSNGVYLLTVKYDGNMITQRVVISK